MMKVLILSSLSVMVLISVANAQRGSYAGVRPIINGIKGDFPTPDSGISSRFGGSELPIDALGDVNLVNKLSERPRYQQPFWLLNYEQIEAHRNNPQLTGVPYASRGSFQGRRRR
jgi:hypothetical protein